MLLLMSFHFLTLVYSFTHTSVSASSSLSLSLSHTVHTYTQICTAQTSKTHRKQSSVQAVPLSFPTLLTTSEPEYLTELSKASLHYWIPWILSETLKHFLMVLPSPGYLKASSTQLGSSIIHQSWAHWYYNPVATPRHLQKLCSCV